MTENNKTENNRHKLYDALQPHISNIGSWNDFNARMDNEANRRKVYEAAQKYVANIGAWDDFNARVYDAPAVAAGTEATAEVANGNSFAIESNGSNESNMAAASTQSNLSDVQKSINEARLRRIQGSWDSFIADSHDRVQRIAGSLDPKERERRERARFAARVQYGLNPDVMPFGSGKKPAEDSDESQAQSSDSNNGNRLTPMSSPEVYDVTLDADGKPSVRWQLADGSLTERRIEAAEQESQAKQWRLMKAFEGRMKQNGLDLSNQEHVKQQALIDAINGGRIDGEQRDELRKEFAGNGLDVDNKEHVAWMVTGNTRKILEYRLTVAEDRLKSLVQQRQANKDKQTDEQPWYLKIGAAFQEGNSNMHPTPRGSHAGLADNKVDKEIEEATAEVAALSRSISHYDRNTSAKDKGWFGKVLQGLWDGITDPNTWSMGVVDMSVNSTMAHADDASDSGRRLLESGVMAQQLEAEAPNPGGFYSGGHFAGELVGDPSNWFITGAASKAATLSARAAVNVMAKRTAKGMTREVAERFVKSKLRNRLLIAGASQAGFFGAFDGLRDMRQQVIDGGWTDAGYTDEDGVYHPGEFHSGFSPWHAASAAGRGSAIGFGMGFFGAGWGNVASKMVGATGGVNRVLAYGEGKAIGFEIESTVFAAPDMISYMTMDDAEFDRRYAASYGYADETDPSKRDKARRAARGEMIVDAWTESQANLLALKLGGKMMTPGAGRSAIGSVRDVIDGLRVRDARDHRTFEERVASIIGSSPYDITLKQSDIDELRDAGYDADLFRSDGPVEVMERNADESFSESGKAESVGAVPGLDGYEMAQRLMEDTTVPQEVRAKVYYIVTGHVLPKGTVMGYRKTENDDGSQTVEALTANGEVISRHEYTSAGAAEREVSDLERQVELNTVEVGERGRSSAIVRDITCKACEEVAKRHGWVVDDVVSAYERAVKDISGKEAETDGKEAETTG